MPFIYYITVSISGAWCNVSLTITLKVGINRSLHKNNLSSK